MARSTHGVCARCRVDKSADMFPVRADGRRRRVCQACLDAERDELDMKRGTRTVGRRKEKFCAACERWLPATTKFFYPDRRHGPKGLMRPCRECKRALNLARRTAILADPVRAAEFQARAAESRRRWEAANPDASRRMRAEWARKAMRNPAYRKRRNEAQRMAYRLRREREGRPLPPAKYVKGPPPRSLPAAPLAAFIEAQAAKRVELNGHAHEAVCVALGITDRDYRAWRSGERPTVTFDVVDRVLQRSDALWFDVFDDGDPVTHAQAAAIFEG